MNIISKKKQGVIAIICAIAMIVTSLTIYNPREAKADTSVAVDGKQYSATVKDGGEWTGFVCQGIFDSARIHFAWGIGVDANSITASINENELKIDGKNANGMFIPLTEVSGLEIGSYEIIVKATTIASESSPAKEIVAKATLKIEKVEVYSADDIIKIKVTFKSVNLKAKLKEDDFVLEDLIDVTKDENKTTDNKDANKDTNKNENTENKNGTCSGTNCKDNKTCEGNTCDKTTGTLDSIIYPLYIPTNTHLKSSETIDTAAGSRVILTFAGDKNFVIVEETASKASSFEVIPVFGDPLMLDKTIGALSSNSISWNSENISYYLVSSDLSSNEMVSVAKSLGNSKTVLSTK